MGYPVKALKAGKWFDSATRESHEVKPGTVVEFGSLDDATYFVNAGAGQHHTPDAPDTSAEQAEAKPARRGKAP